MDAEFLEVDGTPIAVSPPSPAAGRGWCGWAVTDPTCGAPRPKPSMPGRHGKGARSCGMTIPVMANRAGRSAPARCRDGSTRASAVFRRVTKGRQILVGSSMGAWMALRMVAKLTGKAGQAAADRRAGADCAGAGFHQRADRARADRRRRSRDLAERGYIEEPSAYSAEPLYLYTCVDRGRPPQPGDDRADRHPLSGAYHAGLGRPGRADGHALKLVELPAGRRRDRCRWFPTATTGCRGPRIST